MRTVRNLRNGVVEGVIRVVSLFVEGEGLAGKHGDWWTDQPPRINGFWVRQAENRVDIVRMVIPTFPIAVVFQYLGLVRLTDSIVPTEADVSVPDYVAVGINVAGLMAIILRSSMVGRHPDSPNCDRGDRLDVLPVYGKGVIYGAI
jgi:hypothetical protein